MDGDDRHRGPTSSSWRSPACRPSPSSAGHRGRRTTGTRSGSASARRARAGRSWASTSTAPRRCPGPPRRRPAAGSRRSRSPSQSGVQIVADAAAHGGNRVGYIDNGDWIGFSGVSVTGRTGFTARVASGGSGGTIQVRAGSATGPLLGSVAVPNTGGYGAYADVTTALTAGSGALFLVFTGSGSGPVRHRRLRPHRRHPAGDEPRPEQARHRRQPVRRRRRARRRPSTAATSGGNADKWCSLGATKWWRVDLAVQRHRRPRRRPARRRRRRERHLQHPRLRHPDQRRRHHLDHRRPGPRQHRQRHHQHVRPGRRALPPAERPHADQLDRPGRAHLRVRGVRLLSQAWLAAGIRVGAEPPWIQFG